MTPVPWSRCFCSCDQMVNSERLKAHFEDNPRDLQVLRHDAALRPAAVRPSLATVPDYLVPDSLKAAAAAAKDSAGGGAWALDDTMGIEDTGRRRGRKRGRRSHGDPLKTFAVNAAAFGAINAVRSAWAVDVCRVLTLCAAGGSSFRGRRTRPCWPGQALARRTGTSGRRYAAARCSWARAWLWSR